jgi:hypothetical protein
MKSWDQWLSLLDKKEEGTSLALFRILVGLVVLCDLGNSWIHGAIPLIWGDVRSTPEGFRKVHSGYLFNLLGSDFSTVQVVISITALGAGFLTLGVFSRISAFITLQGCIAIYGLNAMAGGGHDRMITNALWLLVLAKSAQTFSLSCRVRTGSWWDTTLVPAWPRYLVILQLIAIYTTTGLQKMAPEWFPWGGYRAVYNMLLTTAWARYDLSPYLGWLSPLTMGATATTWLWESTFWVVGIYLWKQGQPGLWSRYDLRTLYAGLGVLFHGGLWLLADLGPFSAISLALYPCLFSPRELRRPI